MFGLGGNPKDRALHLGVTKESFEESYNSLYFSLISIESDSEIFERHAAISVMPSVIFEYDFISWCETSCTGHMMDSDVGIDSRAYVF